MRRAGVADASRSEADATLETERMASDRQSASTAAAALALLLCGSARAEPSGVELASWFAVGVVAGSAAAGAWFGMSALDAAGERDAAVGREEFDAWERFSQANAGRANLFFAV